MANSAARNLSIGFDLAKGDNTEHTSSALNNPEFSPGGLKRGFYGIYHSFSEKHLQRYVSEFTYRLNEGHCKIHTMDRIDALLRKVVGKRMTYAALIA